MNSLSRWMSSVVAFCSGLLRKLWGKADSDAGVAVPIRALSERHRARIRAHLLKLNSEDRYLRFGYSASDEQVQRYADGLNFEQDDVFGVFNRGLHLVAVAHLAYTSLPGYQNCAEFGVSVLKKARGLRLGTRLFERAMLHARNQGVEMMFIHALSENTAMLKIARNAGARVERDGSESEAYLQLPPAGLESKVTEMVNQQAAEIDYQLKKQAQQFWSILSDVQMIRQDMRDGREN